MCMVPRCNCMSFTAVAPPAAQRGVFSSAAYNPRPSVFDLETDKKYQEYITKQEYEEMVMFLNGSKERADKLWRNLVMPTQVREGGSRRQTYMIEVSSMFVLNERLIQTLLTNNCKVVSVEVETRAITAQEITSVDSAVKEILRVGYRTIARQYHPDYIEDDSTKKRYSEIMVFVNKAKKELEDLLKELTAND